MKFLEIYEFYHAFVEQVYLSEPDLPNRSYHRQLAFLYSCKFGWSDFWPMYIRQKYGWETASIIFNVEPLQRAWAKENIPDLAQNCSLLDILYRQVLAYQPDILFVHTHALSPTFVRELRGGLPNLRFIFGIDGIHACDALLFKDYDLMLAILPETKDFYESQGLPSLLIRAGFDKSVLPVLKKRNKNGVRGDKNRKKIPISFVGSLFLGKNQHISRAKLLYSLSQKIPIQLYLSGLYEIPKNRLKYILGGIWRGEFWERRMTMYFQKRDRGAKFGLAMYQTLQDSLLSLNAHIDAAGKRVGNMRLFEATGVGSCLLTDYKPNLKDFFEPDSEVVAYSSVSEAIEKANYLIEHPTYAREIAVRGQRRTLRDYTLDKTVDYAMENILSKL